MYKSGVKSMQSMWFVSEDRCKEIKSQIYAESFAMMVLSWQTLAET